VSTIKRDLYLFINKSLPGRTDGLRANEKENPEAQRTQRERRERQKQILFEDDNKKSKGKDKGKCRDPFDSALRAPLRMTAWEVESLGCARDDNKKGNIALLPLWVSPYPRLRWISRTKRSSI
jgi:hypothetical protein